MKASTNGCFWISSSLTVTLFTSLRRVNPAAFQDLVNVADEFIRGEIVSHHHKVGVLTGITQHRMLLLVALWAPGNVLPPLYGGELAIEKDEKIRLPPLPKPRTNRVLLGKTLGVIAPFLESCRKCCLA